MDCRAFASKHADFIDDTLPGVDMTDMRDHAAECLHCARRDVVVRRALMTARNLPPVHVSEGFQERLRTRLESEWRSAEGHARRTARGPLAWAAAAALVALVAGIATGTRASRRETAPIRLPAVIASGPAATGQSTDDSAPAHVASMSTGIPMWPALMLAEEGPLRFAATGLQITSPETSRQHD